MYLETSKQPGLALIISFPFLFYVKQFHMSDAKPEAVK